MVGVCGTYGGEWKCIQVLVNKPEGKRPLGRFRRTWGDNNNKIDPEEIELEGVDWINFIQDVEKWRAVLNTIMKFGFHKMRVISWLAERLFVPQEGLCSMELIDLSMVKHSQFSI